MNKKTIRLAALIGLAIVLIALLWPPKPPKGAMGNDFQMEVPDKDAESTSGEITGVYLYMDVSGSMRGFVDFAGLNSSSVSASMKTVVTKFLDNVELKFTPPTCYYGSVTADKDQFRTNLLNSRVFNEPMTEVDKMIDKMVANPKDGNVSLLVSDMMLSFGRSVLVANHDPWYNVHHLKDLQANVHSSMTKALKANLHVLIIQYESDYNGRFYCNCTENIITPQSYRDSLMRRRPYYILAMGKEDALRGLLANDCFDNSFVSIYSTFDMGNCKKQPFSVDVSGTTWAIGYEEGEGTIYSDAKGALGETLSFSCDIFYLPKYAALDFNQVKPSIPDESKGIIRSVTQNVNGNRLVYQVSLEEYNKISIPKDGKRVSFDLVANPGTTMMMSNLNNDVNDGNETSPKEWSMKDLEGKTFSIEATLKAINDVYFGSDNRPDFNVGTVSFRICKIN